MEPTGQSPNIMMMVGLPGSGKSSVIRRLLADFADKEYVVLSPDDLVLDMGRQDGLNYTQTVRKFGFKKKPRVYSSTSSSRHWRLGRTSSSIAQILRSA